MHEWNSGRQPKRKRRRSEVVEPKILGAQQEPIAGEPKVLDSKTKMKLKFDQAARR